MRRSGVELLLAACLLAAAWPRGAPPGAACPLPGLLPARPGQAPRVSCEGDGEPLTGALPLLFGRRLDPSLAEAEALAHLPGVGPARSAALLEARRERPLCRPRDLLRARGIGPRTLARLRPYLRFGDPRCAPGESPPLDSAAGGESG